MRFAALRRHQIALMINVSNYISLSCHLTLICFCSSVVFDIRADEARLGPPREAPRLKGKDSVL